MTDERRELEEVLAEISPPITMHVKHCGLVQNAWKQNNEKNYKQDHWIVTLQSKNDPNQKLVIDYYTGLGLRKRQIQGLQVCSHSVHGMIYRTKGVTWRTPEDACERRWITPVQPTIVDVLGCLLREGDVLDYDTFAEYCDSIGGNADSIKEKTAYEKMRETSSKLKKLLGVKLWEELRECEW